MDIIIEEMRIRAETTPKRYYTISIVEWCTHGHEETTGSKKRKECKEERKDIQKSESLEILVDDQIFPLYWSLDRERKRENSSSV